MNWGKTEYRELPEFPGYVIGSDGSVWSRIERVSFYGAKYRISETKMHRLKIRKNRTGYHRVALYDGETSHTRMIHRLVLEVFVGPCPSGMVACHANDNKDDNSLSNLRWDTPESNWADRKRNGRMTIMRGEQHPMAKLSYELARRIRAEYLNTKQSRIDLAEKYGVCPTTILRVVNGRIWA